MPTGRSGPYYATRFYSSQFERVSAFSEEEVRLDGRGLRRDGVRDLLPRREAGKRAPSEFTLLSWLKGTRAASNFASARHGDGRTYTRQRANDSPSERSRIARRTETNRTFVVMPIHTATQIQLL